MPDDVYDIGTTVLDNTPWWVHDNRRGTERSLGFCNPFGYEDDSTRVMGGTRNPDAEPYHWQCRNYAEGRYVMTCANGHRGTMTLCYAHVYQITRRMSGICPRCVWPPRARELDERMTYLMRELSNPYCWPDDRQRMASALEDARREMDELRERGTIQTGAPLRLEERS